MIGFGNAMQNKASSFTGRRIALAAAATALVLAAGCQSRTSSITVGAIPDDYRVNHPIMIGEKERKVDLPVAMSARGITQSQRIALEGFLADYDREAQPPVTIIVPNGSANEVAAGHVARDMARILQRNGVPAHRIGTAVYPAKPEETAAPIRVSYSAIKAYTNRCGRWPADIGSSVDNKHYANFGCAAQNNLAAQIADPADLVGPRKMSPIDAENRGTSITEYKTKQSTFEPEIEY